MNVSEAGMPRFREGLLTERVGDEVIVIMNGTTMVRPSSESAP